MEHAAQKNTLTTQYGQQNEYIISSLQQAYSAVLQLVQDGFTVLDVCVRNSRPVIKVQNCAKCATLKGVTTVYGRDTRGSKHIKASLVKSAQVEWVVRGH